MSGEGPAKLGHAVVLVNRAQSLFVRTDEFGALTVPKGVVHDDSEVYDGPDGKEGELVVLQWWAERELGT